MIAVNHHQARVILAFVCAYVSRLCVESTRSHERIALRVHGQQRLIEWMCPRAFGSSKRVPKQSEVLYGPCFGREVPSRGVWGVIWAKGERIIKVNTKVL